MRTGSWFGEATPGVNNCISLLFFVDSILTPLLVPAKRILRIACTFEQLCADIVPINLRNSMHEIHDYHNL